MPRRLLKEINRLKKRILALGDAVEENVRLSVQAFESRDRALAVRIVESDLDIDEAEVDIEEEGLKVLALYQPVATDLRYIVAILKINNDLERIGDLAVGIARCTDFLDQEQPAEIPFDFETMSETAQQMLHLALESLVNVDPDMARRVLEADDVVDDINHQVYDRVERGIRENTKQLRDFIQYLIVARNLERIADLATNIAEDVIYLCEGEIVRHKGKPSPED